jgi:hypothetical protein
LTADLRVAKQERQHKEEYEALALRVDGHASKPSSRAAAAQVEANMARLASEKGRLDGFTAARRRQFALLLAAVGDLATVLDEEPFEAASADETQADDEGRRARDATEQQQHQEEEEEDGAGSRKRPKA